MRILKLKRSRVVRRLHPLKKFLDLGLLGDGTWLAGGALRSLLDGTEIKDYDLFFRSNSAYLEARSKLIKMGAKLVFECPAHELCTYVIGNMKIQLITLEYYSNLESCLNTFDINACRLGLDFGYLYIAKSALKDIRSKKVSLYSHNYPLATLNRLIKYKAKGYKIGNALEALVVDLHGNDPETPINLRRYAD